MAFRSGMRYNFGDYAFHTSGTAGDNFALSLATEPQSTFLLRGHCGGVVGGPITTARDWIASLP